MRIKLCALIALLLSAAALLSLAACGGNNMPSSTPAPTEAEVTSGAEAEQEAPFLVFDLDGSFASNTSEKLFETHDTVYYLTGGDGSAEYRVYFTDKDYRDWMLLCGRPDCTHRNYDCGAYLGGDAGSPVIWPYGNSLYYFIYNEDDTPELWRMKLDGTAHEKLFTCGYSDLGDHFPITGWSWYFHNKYAIVYFCGSSSFDIDDPARVMVDLVIDLSSDKLEQRPFDLGQISTIGAPLAGEGDILYCSQSFNNNMLVKANLADMTVEEITELPFPLYGGGSLRGDILYFLDTYYMHKLGAVDLKTGELLFCRDLPTAQYGRIFGDRFILSGNTDEGEHLGTTIYDFDLNIIQHIPYEDIGKNISVTAVTDSYVFGFDRDVRSESSQAHPPMWYLDLSETGTPALAWRRWEP